MKKEFIITAAAILLITTPVLASNNNGNNNNRNEGNINEGEQSSPAVQGIQTFTVQNNHNNQNNQNNKDDKDDQKKESSTSVHTNIAPSVSPSPALEHEDEDKNKKNDEKPSISEEPCQSGEHGESGQCENNEPDGQNNNHDDGEVDIRPSPTATPSVSPTPTDHPVTSALSILGGGTSPLDNLGALLARFIDFLTHLL